MMWVKQQVILSIIPDGLRASKTIGTIQLKYYYDGDNVINETLNNNNYATNVMGVNGYVSRRQNGYNRLFV